ncbi:hypothetical protein QOZ80_4BG0340000 [Eleusine coracana subsp. coracana]|nr:hypothetical protein QOZ80_4BG0340000 [Eleusine coracana subsp. coracana]
MKVQCDVCAVKAASVFCCADEAALCDACDRRVHCANKLAGKHRRFPLVHAQPSSSPPSAQKKPLCDICKERKGFLFCKEERSILCRDCDVRVHTANELMRRHSRFLLTDVRLSSAPVEDSPAVPEKEGQEEQEEDKSSSPGIADSFSAATASASDGSSISEYLTKTLPGWHVEDFLVDEADAGIPACSGALDQGGQAHVGGLLELDEICPAWAVGGPVLSDVAVVTADERASRERWVPQMQMHAADSTGSKRPRASPPCSYW